VAALTLRHEPPGPPSHDRWCGRGWTPKRCWLFVMNTCIVMVCRLPKRSITRCRNLALIPVRRTSRLLLAMMRLTYESLSRSPTRSRSSSTCSQWNFPPKGCLHVANAQQLCDYCRYLSATEATRLGCKLTAVPRPFHRSPFVCSDSKCRARLCCAGKQPCFSLCHNG